MQCPIHRTELICHACFAAAGGRAGGTARTPSKLKASNKNLEKAIQARVANARAKREAAALKRAERESRTWTLADCLAYFEEHPNQEVGAATLIEATTTGKRASAERYAAQRLCDLHRRGTIEKLGPGVYRKGSF